MKYIPKVKTEDGQELPFNPSPELMQSFAEQVEFSLLMRRAKKINKENAEKEAENQNGEKTNN